MAALKMNPALSGHQCGPSRSARSAPLGNRESRSARRHTEPTQPVVPQPQASFHDL